MPDKYTEELILQILHSIKKISLSNGEIEVYFEDSKCPEGKYGFIYGSFTRELLELCEKYLNSERPE